jgi:hypothetical protein
MGEYSGYAEELYNYEELPTETSYRVLELLPGKGNDPISCLLHVTDWESPLEYEAISYAWGDPKVTAPVNVHDKMVEVTVNLHTGLEHLRYQDQSRFLWADALWYVIQESLWTRGLFSKLLMQLVWITSSIDVSLIMSFIRWISQH